MEERVPVEFAAKTEREQAQKEHVHG